jgi:hypothetical protein
LLYNGASLAKKRPATPADKRNQLRREADIRRRLSAVEDLARANRRELEVQFRRIASMQVEIDALKKANTHD